MQILNYFLASFFILSGMGAFTKGLFLPGTMLLVLGTLLLPPISNLLSRNVRLWNSKGTRYISYAVILLFVGAMTKKPYKAVNAISTEVEINHKANNQPNVIIQNDDKIEMDNSDFWNDFDPIVKERIYNLIKAKDCHGLQEEFNITADNMERLQATRKSGSRNLDLMGFLEDEMKKLECY